MGETLNRLKEFTTDMSPQEKGIAIGNIPELARAHNSHARPDPFRLPEKQQCVTVRTAEAFHFVSYVPLKGRLFELDGLKPYPIDHGPWGEREDWTEKFRRVINERIAAATGGENYHDIRFNLMAVVPEKKQQFEQKLTTLRMNRQIVLEALQRMVKVAGSENDLGMTSPVRPGRAVASKAEPMMTRSKRKGSRRSGGSSRHSSPRDKTSPITAADDVAGDGGDVTVTAVHKADDDEFAGVTSSKLTSVVTRLERRFEEKLEPENQQQGGGGSAVKIEIKTLSGDNDGAVTMPITVASTDVCKPLIINTKFSGSPGPDSESTDTASEVGSLLNSPVFSTSSQNSPSHPASHYSRAWSGVMHDVTDHRRTVEAMDDNSKKRKIETMMAESQTRLQNVKLRVGEPAARDVIKSQDGSSPKNNKSGHQGFTPKDLLALLKNVETEITITEISLRDELEKRKKYKIDDCRRTHNYEKFICSFLTVLAEQGQLTSLVEQQMIVSKKKPAPPSKVATFNKTVTKAKTTVQQKKQKIKLNKKKK